MVSLNRPTGPFVASTRLSEDVALEVLTLEQGCRNQHWIRSWRSRTLFELSDLDSLVVVFCPVKEKRKGRQPMEHVRGARNGDDKKTKET